MLFTVLALLLGIGIVWALTMVSKKGKGPVENAISTVSETVNNVEQSVILEQRSETRSDKLKWLSHYTSSIQNLRHPKVIFVGAYDNNAVDNNFQPIINLEDTLHTTFPIIHIYTAWGSKKEDRFPTSKVNTIVQLGSIPFITWEPWLSAFNPDDDPQLKPLATREKQGLSDVANGVYDFYIIDWAKKAKKIQSPIILRWAHEMNDPYRYPWGPQNNNANEFIAAWRHVRKVFDSLGVKNVLWAWSPHPAYGYFKEYYPGDDVVDYVALGTLNYGTVASWSQWWSFSDIFGKYYSELASFKKPIIISEFGSLSVGGNRSKWFGDALKDIPKKYPGIKGVLFFHCESDKTTTQQTLNWYFIDDPSVVNSIRTQINDWPENLR